MGERHRSLSGRLFSSSPSSHHTLSVTAHIFSLYTYNHLGGADRFSCCYIPYSIFVFFLFFFYIALSPEL
jgi:prepilin signal peptidase PulO-like enzyme (type II secretory pathway)